jgi:hypothetical protein
MCAKALVAMVARKKVVKKVFMLKDF